MTLLGTFNNINLCMWRWYDIYNICEKNANSICAGELKVKNAIWPATLSCLDTRGDWQRSGLGRVGPRSDILPKAQCREGYDSKWMIYRHRCTYTLYRHTISIWRKTPWASAEMYGKGWFKEEQSSPRRGKALVGTNVVFGYSLAWSLKCK